MTCTSCTDPNLAQVISLFLSCGDNTGHVLPIVYCKRSVFYVILFSNSLHKKRLGWCFHIVVLGGKAGKVRWQILKQDITVYANAIDR